MNVRVTPYGSVLGIQPLDARGAIVQGPVSSSGFLWWQINYETGADGWSVENYLEKAAPPTPSTKFTIGDRAQTTDNLNVRSVPGGTVLGVKPTSTQGTVIGGPQYFGGAYWWQMNYDTDPDGWSIETYLTKLLSP